MLILGIAVVVLRERVSRPVALYAGAAPALVFALVLLAGSLALSHPEPLDRVSATPWVSAVAAGAIYYGVAFWFYLGGLRGVTASSAGVFINLVQVFGIAASYIVLGERLSPRQWVGAIVVIAAVGASALYVGRRVSAEDGAQRVEA